MDSEREEILETDTLGRVRTSRERREAILDDFEGSSLSAAAYARLHGIGYSTFANWVQRRRKHRAEPAGEHENGRRSGEAPGALALTLAEVRVEREDGSPECSIGGHGGGLRVELPGGATLVIGDAGQAELAAALLRRLQGDGRGESSRKTSIRC